MNIFLGNPPENIKQQIIDHYGSKDDPEIKDEYYALAAEFGEGIFVLKDNVSNNVPLTKEEQEISNA